MARIRTIKPSFWSDDDVASLSRDARLLLIGLISMADDEGRFVATHQTIVGYVFPWDQIPQRLFQRWLTEITDRPIVELYSYDNRPYGWFPKWLKHQKINRPQPSSLPPPPSMNGSRSHSVNDSRSGSRSRSRSDQ